MRNPLRWIFGIVLGLIVLCTTFSTVSCTKEKTNTITGPTEYDTTQVVVHDTIRIVDSVATWQTAATVIHEFYAVSYPSDVFEFMAFASIPVAYPSDPTQYGSKLLGLNKYEITGVVYVWSAQSYYQHIDTAQFTNGTWLVDGQSTGASSTSAGKSAQLTTRMTQLISPQVLRSLTN